MFNAKSTKISPVLIFDKPAEFILTEERRTLLWETLSISDGRTQDYDISESLKSVLRLVFQSRDSVVIG